MAKTVLFSGGGSGGHVLPAITLIQDLKRNHSDIEIGYIGGKAGIEKDLIAKLGIPYFSVTNGKLRRYFSWENFKDLFRVLKGVAECWWLLRNYPKDTLIFCTGGFVTVPVAFAGFLRGMSVYVHEQTTRVGLANRICALFAKKVFVTFEESVPFLPKGKTIVSGYPLRPEVSLPAKDPLVFEGVNLDQAGRPILFLTGGGNGSLPLNQLLIRWLPDLSKRYVIIHQVGAQFIDQYRKLRTDFYIPVAFVGAEMIDLLKKSSVVISRAGAGTVCELLALGKPSILIPLKFAQKNEQFHNAMAAKKLLGSIVLEEDAVPTADLPELCRAIESAPRVTVREDLAKGRNFLIQEMI